MTGARGGLALALLVLAAPTASAQIPGVASDTLRVEAKLERTRSGRSIVTGYVYNDHGLWADHVRLRVEVLGAAARVVAQVAGYVHGMIAPGDRLYFEASVPGGGARVRVTIESAEWGGPGLGGG